MIIGITGGIGSGKSSLARALEKRGAVLVDADRIGHQVIEGPEVRAALKAAFGEDIADREGRLKRRELGRRAFADPAARERLNRIVHPPLATELWGQVERAAGPAGENIVVVDAALIFEWGELHRYDIIVVVDAAESVRVGRVTRSLGLSEAEVGQRMASQMPVAEKVARADVVVENNGTLPELEECADRLWQQLGAISRGEKKSEKTMKEALDYTDCFARRHIGPDAGEIARMLEELGEDSLDDLIERVVPRQIRMPEALQLGEGTSEHGLLEELRGLAGQNQLFRSFIGMGYADCITPPVIQRNILENPGWYTQYTPYQSEIAQGRLEALLNFQTMVIDLTGMEIANASLLDEATAAAEAMAMIFSVQKKNPARSFFVSSDCHPQTIAVVRTRAQSRGWEVIVGDHRTFEFQVPVFGALVQYPATDGAIGDLRGFVEEAHAHGALVAVAADILSLTLLTPPGEFGADVVVGSTQRLGMPMGYGGPHAAYFATREAYKRQMPGRIIGVSEDSQGHPALRMALQTREQHIRREKATSNICTAQVLPAVVASMYAVYHGPEGLEKIACRIHALTRLLDQGCRRLGYEVVHEQFFDTLCLRMEKTAQQSIVQRGHAQRMNFRPFDTGMLGLTLDEATSIADLDAVFAVLVGDRELDFSATDLGPVDGLNWDPIHCRQTSYLTHPVFSSYRSETEMLRYISRLQARDLSLTTSMIPLGSCTMKLNATVEMMPITWPEFARLHPFVPSEQARGYQTILTELTGMLQEITGFAGVSFQPNSGAQGEYAGLLVLRQYHQSQEQGHRDVCLIPASAHGTNPASAVMAGLEVVVVGCDDQGNIDLEDLRRKAVEYGDRLAALMVTYPSTHGVFEAQIREICTVIHEHGGQVYMDGANMNALVGLCRPGDIGVDVCHLNLHKTFCIPHGGGGPGMGPIAVAAHLVDFLPDHPVVPVGGKSGLGAVAAAPWGSALILLISWAYIKLMGGEGLTQATRVAILNANYVAQKLEPFFPVLYRGESGFVAHEAILDLRRCKASAGVTVEDVAKRLMDYGFHAPTVAFPVPDTLMVEPTESESRAELDRFCQAMIAIRGEIEEIESGQVDRENNVLKNAPHTLDMVMASEWTFPYSRIRAAMPAEGLAAHKFWPAVARLNNALGDRHLVCACVPVEAYA